MKYVFLTIAFYNKSVFDSERSVKYSDFTMMFIAFFLLFFSFPSLLFLVVDFVPKSHGFFSIDQKLCPFCAPITYFFFSLKNDIWKKIAIKTAKRLEMCTEIN